MFPWVNSQVVLCKLQASRGELVRANEDTCDLQGIYEQRCLRSVSPFDARSYTFCSACRFVLNTNGRASALQPRQSDSGSLIFTPADQNHSTFASAEIRHVPHGLARVLMRAGKNASAVDYGCLGFRLNRNYTLSARPLRVRPVCQSTPSRHTAHR
jgi:hypothetical protein